MLVLFYHTRIDAVSEARSHRLARKAVHHIVDRIGLIGLDLELELHAVLFLHSFCNALFKSTVQKDVSH